MDLDLNGLRRTRLEAEQKKLSPWEAKRREKAQLKEALYQRAYAEVDWALRDFPKRLKDAAAVGHKEIMIYHRGTNDKDRIALERIVEICAKQGLQTRTTSGCSAWFCSCQNLFVKLP